MCAGSLVPLAYLGVGVTLFVLRWTQLLGKGGEEEALGLSVNLSDKGAFKLAGVHGREGTLPICFC